MRNPEDIFETPASSTTTAWGTSPDGITWTARTGPGGSGVYGVVAGNGTFVAVISSVIYSSTDGITWTARTIPTSATLPYISPTSLSYPVYVNGQFVIGGVNSTYGTYIGNQNFLLSSGDGINWGLKQIGLYVLPLGNGGFAANSTVFITAFNSSSLYLYGTLLANPVGIYAPPATTI